MSTQRGMGAGVLEAVEEAAAASSGPYWRRHGMAFYLHTFTYIYIHLHTFTYVYIHLHTFSHIYIHLHTFTCIYIRRISYTYIDKA